MEIGVGKGDMLARDQAQHHKRIDVCYRSVATEMNRPRDLATGAEKGEIRPQVLHLSATLFRGGMSSSPHKKGENQDKGKRKNKESVLLEKIKDGARKVCHGPGGNTAGGLIEGTGGKPYKRKYPFHWFSHS